MRVRRRHEISRNELKKLKRVVRENLGEDFLEILNGKKFELVHTDKELNLLLIDSNPIFLLEGHELETLFPTLNVFMNKDCRRLKNYVTVDMGAVGFVTNGADVMRPGIVDLDNEIEKNDFVVITEEKYGKPLAVGRALFSGRDILKMKKGKVVQNLHYVGDKIWELEV